METTDKKNKNTARTQVENNTTASVSNGVAAETTTKEYVIDANGKRLGRVATEAASVLLGKNRPDFRKHVAIDVKVKIENVKQLDISERREKETFETYSGYQGGRKVETLGHLAARRGYDEVVRRVISGMLPKNKLHKRRMQNLEVTE